MAEVESWCVLQAAPAPPPPPVTPTPLVAQPPEDPMGLADVVATAVPGWYTLLHCCLAKGLPPFVSAHASALQN